MRVNAKMLMIDRKFSRLHLESCSQCDNCPKSLKLSGKSGNFQANLETFRIVWKLTGHSGNFPDSLETFRTVWELSGQSGNFLDSLETFRTV